MRKILRTLQRIRPAVWRHIFGMNTRPYARILQHICSQHDIWVTTQGEYMQWWCEREAMRVSIQVSDGRCSVQASSPRAVFEQYPGRFLDTSSFACSNATFSGACVITIDREMAHQATLIEILKREGILNYCIASDGDFFLSSQELDPVLEQARANMERRDDQPDMEDVRAILDIVRQKLAAHSIPLLRVWYHPRMHGVVPKAVFSPRYDVDRAITNMGKIRELEQKFGVECTFYIRAFCPFYTDEDVEQMSTMSWCPEIALHGEFVTNARNHGNELQAALAEKAHLEQVVHKPVLGIGMHGGELRSNRTGLTNQALRGAEMLYDTTPRPWPGNYLPYRKIIDGKFSNVYGLPHALSDVNIEANLRYGQVLYTSTVEMMRQIRAANGVFVFMMHPEYFGFLAYLARPANLVALLKFMAGFVAGDQRTESSATFS